MKQSWFGRHRSMMLLAVALLAAIAVTVWSGGSSRTYEAVDPDNPGADGAQALARVLDGEGVDVDVARTADEFEDTEVDADTTVVVTSTDYLGTTTIDRLLEHAGDSGRLVLVSPAPGVTEAVGIAGYPQTELLGEGRESGCEDPLFDGLTIEVDTADAYAGDDGCFVIADASVVLEREGVTLFGAGQAMTNDQILRADNAAAVLRLLGENDRLVWYVANLDDLVGDDGVSAETLLPRWVWPGLWVGAIAVLGLMLWRVRRLGALATEPLPVVVKAIETTRSRGRLYRRAGDRGHAATALRRAARTRAAERLRLGAESDPAAIVRDIAGLTGRSESEISMLLAPDAPAPASDNDLIALARDLAELDREVHRT